MDRHDLLTILEAGLEAADGRRCVREFLLDRRPQGPLTLIAVGKASTAMTLGAVDVLGAALDGGYVVTPLGHGDEALSAMPRFRTVPSSHPVPDQRSLEAGDGLLSFVSAMAPGTRVLVLISGGASSLVESLPAGLDAGDLSRVNQFLLGSGLDIFGVNGVRRRLSMLKDGRLAAALRGHPVLALYLSDVEGDDPAWIGSGLLSRAKSALPSGLPDWLVTLIHSGPPPGLPTPPVESHVVGNLARALDGCEDRARRLGFPVTRHDEWLRGPVAGAADRIVSEMDDGRAGIHLWGGETTMILPAAPGRGGRNQHLALCCATAIQGRDDLAVLCCATDGVDGNSEDAGGLVDGQSIRRGRDGGADPADCLRRADSGTFLEAAGDLIFTGPTSTNVNDVVIGLKAVSG
ncbi:MAG: DUF4147 domain-containing protein [Gammaproteobacteria bacterium]